MHPDTAQIHAIPDRGVSEALGFVFVFVIIITTIAVVYSGGFANLQDVRDVERVNNAQRAFDVLAENVEDIVLRGAPDRATEIKLADARLTSPDPVVINITGDYQSGSSDDEDFTSNNRSAGPIVYTAGADAELRYVLGALIRVRGNDAGMIREPPFVLHGNRLVVPVIESRTGAATDVGGSTTVLIRTTLTTADTVRDLTDSGPYDEITINVTTPHPAPWRHYFEDGGLTCTTVGSGTWRTVSCDATAVEEVYTPVFTVDVAFED